MGFLAEARRELQPRSLLSSLTVGLLAGVMVLGMEISLAAYIFSGDLKPFLAHGIGVMLFGALILGVVVSLVTSLPGAIAVPQDTPAAILALLGAGIALTMKSAAPQALLATFLAAIAVTSLLMAAILLLIGHFRLGGFVRYIPYPVVGGFLAGTGWLLAQGGLGVMLDIPLTVANLPRLFTPDRLMAWLPGVVFGITLLLVLRRHQHSLITPGALVLITSLFYGLLLVTGTSVAEASSRGWLLGPFPAGAQYQPLTPAILSQVNWLAILGQADKIATVLVLCLIGILLNASTLEIAVGRDIDLNRELITAGTANLAGGLSGATIGYQTIGLTVLAHRLGAPTRLVGVVSGLICGIALFFGASLFSFIPKVVLGSMLIYLGSSFLVEWLIDSRRSLPLWDYLLIWVILVIILAVGFLQAIAVGVLVAAALFVIQYSRVSIIRNVLNGQIFHSNVDRPKDHRDLLNERGAEIQILRLQGFIFFGTIQAILNEVRHRLTREDLPKFNYLVLDFQRVTRLDSSAVFGITRLKQLTQASGILMVWTQVAPTIQRQLERGGLVDSSDDTFIILPTLDHGVEWCENKILAAHGTVNLTAFVERLGNQIKRAFPETDAAESLMKYLELKAIPEGQYLMREGDPPTEMYFVEEGMVTAQLQSEDGQLVRLRSMRGGTTVGEMGLYMGTARTADVIASRSTIVYRLSAEALERMRREEPHLAAMLHEWIARLLAERLAANNRTIEALMD
ncbi:MAG TPA: SulP family inorganic anion transporter [Anaerolineales bacterium]|nr:SulP family inorganic anion transporter [Anaerolineales bacterium]